MLLHGEAGIGKSHLEQVVHDLLAPPAHRWWEWGCEPSAQHSALYPVIAWFQRLLAWQPEAPPAAKLQRLETALAPYHVSLQKIVPPVAALLSIPLGTPYPPLTLTPERQKHVTFDVLIDFLGCVAAQHPLVLLVEDLHWMDASTGEFLAVLLPRVATMRLYLLLTCRPDFHPA